MNFRVILSDNRVREFASLEAAIGHISEAVTPGLVRVEKRTARGWQIVRTANIVATS